MLLAAGCGIQHAGFVPARDSLEGRGRIVSSVVSAGALSYVIDEIYTPSGGNLQGITPGPNGLVWFTGEGVDEGSAVGKSTTESDMQEYPLPGYGDATSVAEGWGHLWVTLLPAVIGRFSTGGDFTAFPIPNVFGGTHSNPYSITKGPDDALWFIANDSGRHIVRVDSTGKMQGYRLPVGSRSQWLTLGSDGALWFTDVGANKIGRMTATGGVTEFSVPTPNAGLTGICQGPGGKLWFLEDAANKVGAVTTSGSFREYNIPTPYSGAFGIVAGPDGALWFTEGAVGKIGRITTSGTIAELKLTLQYAAPLNITVGSDKNLWFTESEAYGVIGRVELHPVRGSNPVYSEISVSLGKGHPELGVSAKFPLTITAYNLSHHVINGHYPTPIHLTTSDAKQAALSQTSVTSSSSTASVIYSGRYTDATIDANADGGGIVQPAIVLPSAPKEKKLPKPGYGLTSGIRRWSLDLPGRRLDCELFENRLG